MTFRQLKFRTMDWFGAIPFKYSFEPLTECEMHEIQFNMGPLKVEVMCYWK